MVSSGDSDKPQMPGIVRLGGRIVSSIGGKMAKKANTNLRRLTDPNRFYAEEFKARVDWLRSKGFSDDVIIAVMYTGAESVIKKTDLQGQSE